MRIIKTTILGVIAVGALFFGVIGISPESDPVIPRKASPDNEYWSRLFGTEGNECASSVVNDSLDNLYIGSYTDKTVNDTYDMCLVKFNNSGDYQWNRTWGGEGHEAILDMVIDSSNNIYATGYTTSYGAGSFDICVVKFNSSGQVEWFSTCGGSGVDIGWGITIGFYGSIYVSGEYDTGSNSEAIVVKFDPDGNYQYNFTYSHSESISANAVVADQISPALVYVAISKSPSSQSLTSDVIIVKLHDWDDVTTPYFAVLEEITWGGPFVEMALAVELLPPSPNNHYPILLIVGMSWNPSTLYDMFLVMMMTEPLISLISIRLEYGSDITIGNNLTIGGPGNDMAYDIVVVDAPYFEPNPSWDFTPKSLIYLVGGTSSGYFEDYDVYLVELAVTNYGNPTFAGHMIILGDYTWGGENDEFAEAIVSDSSGNLFLTGSTWSYGAGLEDTFLIKNLQKKPATEPALISSYDVPLLVCLIAVTILCVIFKKRRPFFDKIHH